MRMRIWLRTRASPKIKSNHVPATFLSSGRQWPGWITTLFAGISVHTCPFKSPGNRQIGEKWTQQLLVSLLSSLSRNKNRPFISSPSFYTNVELLNPAIMLSTEETFHVILDSVKLLKVQIQSIFGCLCQFWWPEHHHVFQTWRTPLHNATFTATYKSYQHACHCPIWYQPVVHRFSLQKHTF